MMSFPHDPKQQGVLPHWIAFTRRTDLHEGNVRSRYICSDHFKVNDGVRSPKGRLMLKKFVIPSVMDGKIVYEPAIDPANKPAFESFHYGVGSNNPLSFEQRKLNFIQRYKKDSQRHVEDELRDQLAIERHRNRTLKAELREKERQLNNPTNEKEITERYLQKILPPALYQFVSSQIAHSIGSYNAPWTKQDRLIASQLRECGKKRYAFLRSILCLPDVRTVRRWALKQRQELLAEVDTELGLLDDNSGDLLDDDDDQEKETRTAIQEIASENMEPVHHQHGTTAVPVQPLSQQQNVISVQPGIEIRALRSGYIQQHQQDGVQHHHQAAADGHHQHGSYVHTIDFNTY